MEGAARCLVSEGGRRIRLAVARDGGDALACLIDSVLAACLQMRGILTLHASAVATVEGAVLIAGQVATGKSTLAAALVDRGYPLLADGIVGVAPAGGDTPLALAGFPCVNLWDGAMNALDKSWRRAAPARTGILRYPVPARHFHSDALPVRAIYVISNFGTADEVVVKPLAPARAFSSLLECTCRFRFPEGAGIRRASTSALCPRWSGARGVNGLGGQRTARTHAALVARMAECLPPPCP